MVYPDFTAGDPLTPTQLEDLANKYVSQGTDQSVTSSTTVVDSALSVPVVAGGVYVIDGYYANSGHVSGDIKLTWNSPGGNILRWIFGPGVSSTGAPTAATEWRNAFTGLAEVAFGANGAIMEHVIFSCSTSGNLILQFAQDTSNATATILQSYSHLVWRRIG